MVGAQTPVKKATKPSQASPTINGKAVYTQYCMPCHQIDGSGVMNMNPPLIKTTYVLGDQTRLINILLKGYNKGVVIDEDEYTNPMPSFSYLSDTQIAAVLTYVRNNFQNKASAITAAQVKKVRSSK
ncbi:cytochrome c [Pedobacter sp. SD-b]|uniref:Cytochrome c n=2 Tax=Pedobacter segetis TaxID=2793069 RepID=A0ABS1BMF5_9SPHI|nr:cytochrome c [Pedobacter segetis]MBK0384075.1 cytochrome c [Pedobacter segetis]